MTNSQSQTVHAVSDRLLSFEIVGLFGEFDYLIPIKTESRITAIIAPNGSGKTICLRLISAFFSKRWSFFKEVTYSRIQFTFLSGIRVSIERFETASEVEGGAPVPGVRFVIRQKAQEPTTWNFSQVASPSRVSFERYLPFLTRVSPARWVHDVSGEHFSAQEIIETFGDSLPDNISNSLYVDAPPLLVNLVNGIDCHLIETQRLLILRGEDNDVHYRRGRPASTLAISKKAETLRSIIAQQLTAYAAMSQSLDRSFPRRVIERQHKVLPPENLRERLQELDRRRQSLMAAGILDTEAYEPVTLPEGTMEEAIARVLSVYAADTLEKLSSLSTLLGRIQLFTELINQRFSTKTVAVSRTAGFEIIARGQKVPLEKLSSGEQHQLVLFFELLFELKQNALILIDEPELSLHVAWQKKFISDLERIIQLNKFDVILATHSPQLISRWTDLVVELGEVDEP